MILDSSIAVTGGLRCAQRMARLLAPFADVTLAISADAQLPADELVHFDEVVRLPLAPLRRSFGAALRYLPGLVRSGAALRKLLREQDAELTVRFGSAC